MSIPKRLQDCKIHFSFEDLEVWQKAIDFAGLVIKLCGNIETDRKHFRLIEQLEAAATSVALNIAEGKGRQYTKEFIQFLHIAQGSIFEVVTLNAVFYRRKLFSSEEAGSVRKRCEDIDRKLNGLINSLRGRKRIV